MRNDRFDNFNRQRDIPQPYIKPDARICCIRLSDWLERFKPHLAED